MIDSLIVYGTKEHSQSRLYCYYEIFYKQAIENKQIDSILWLAWENHNIIKLKGFEHFLKTDKQRTYRNINKYFKVVPLDVDPTEYNYKLCYLSDSTLLFRMLDLAYHSNPSKFKKDVLGHLSSELHYNQANHEIFLITFLSRLNETEINNRLLDILKEVDNPSAYIIAVDAYGEKMTRKFRKQIKKNMILTDQPFWDENIRKELKLRYEKL